MNSVNPMEIVRMIKSGSNPQQIMINYLENQMQNTPMGANLINLARNNRGEEIEQIARNIVAQRGGDFDKEFNAFKQMLGLK